MNISHSVESKPQSNTPKLSNPGFVNWLKTGILNKGDSVAELRAQYEAQLNRPNYEKRLKVLSEKDEQPPKQTSSLIVRKGIPIYNKKGVVVDTHDQLIVEDSRGLISEGNTTMKNGKQVGFKFAEFNANWDQMSNIDKQTKLHHELLHPVVLYCVHQLFPEKEVKNFDTIVEVLSGGVQKVVFPEDSEMDTHYSNISNTFFVKNITSLFAEYFASKNTHYISEFRAQFSHLNNPRAVETFAKEIDGNDINVTYNMDVVDVSKQDFIDFIDQKLSYFASVMSASASEIEGLKTIVSLLDSSNSSWTFEDGQPKELQVYELLKEQPQSIVEKLSHL
jgi:hypothetical protein